MYTGQKYDRHNGCTPFTGGRHEWCYTVGISGRKGGTEGGTECALYSISYGENLNAWNMWYKITELFLMCLWKQKETKWK